MLGSVGWVAVTGAVRSDGAESGVTCCVALGYGLKKTRPRNSPRNVVAGGYEICKPLCLVVRETAANWLTTIQFFLGVRRKSDGREGDDWFRLVP